jgi:hypothetical protein
MTSFELGIVVGMGSLVFGLVNVFAGRPDPGWYAVGLGAFVLLVVWMYSYDRCR